MAEVGADTEAEESSEVGVECAVCLQTSIYPGKILELLNCQLIKV